MPVCAHFHAHKHDSLLAVAASVGGVFRRWIAPVTRTRRGSAPLPAGRGIRVRRCGGSDPGVWRRFPRGRCVNARVWRLGCGRCGGNRRHGRQRFDHLRGGRGCRLGDGRRDWSRLRRRFRRRCGSGRSGRSGLRARCRWRAINENNVHRRWIVACRKCGCHRAKPKSEKEHGMHQHGGKKAKEEGRSHCDFGGA